MVSPSQIRRFNLRAPPAIRFRPDPPAQKKKGDGERYFALSNVGETTTILPEARAAGAVREKNLDAGCSHPRRLEAQRAGAQRLDEDCDRPPPRPGGRRSGKGTRGARSHRLRRPKGPAQRTHACCKTSPPRIYSQIILRVIDRYWLHEESGPRGDRDWRANVKGGGGFLDLDGTRQPARFKWPRWVIEKANALVRAQERRVILLGNFHHPFMGARLQHGGARVPARVLTAASTRMRFFFSFFMRPKRFFGRGPQHRGKGGKPA